ncbi:MAG: DoxX family protein, partial [Bacteroidetes bacterium]|nr:DoxX family protein [Bacteroidota bacterium]
MRYLVILSRILVGALFIVSGLIKANDPLGFSYKLEEYFGVFGMDWMVPFSLAVSILISVSEVILGVATLLGTKMRPVAWSLLGMIVFFTFLTFFSAYFNKVTDCGCFGDAIKLTPWESFTKDIILLFFILIIFINRNKIKSVFNDSFKADWASVGLTTVLSFSFSFYCLWHLP